MIKNLTKGSKYKVNLRVGDIEGIFIGYVDKESSSAYFYSLNPDVGAPYEKIKEYSTVDKKVIAEFFLNEEVNPKQTFFVAGISQIECEIQCGPIPDITINILKQEIND